MSAAIFTVVAASIKVKRLPHGIMMNREPVLTTTAIYHLVEVFGNPETSYDKAFNQGIQEVKTAIKDKGNQIGHEFILARLENIQEQNNQLILSRNRRGIFYFVGDVGSKFFGFGKEKYILEQRGVISDNHDAM